MNLYFPWAPNIKNTTFFCVVSRMSSVQLEGSLYFTPKEKKIYPISAPSCSALAKLERVDYLSVSFSPLKLKRKNTIKRRQL